MKIIKVFLYTFVGCITLSFSAYTFYIVGITAIMFPFILYRIFSGNSRIETLVDFYVNYFSQFDFGTVSIIGLFLGWMAVLVYTLYVVIKKVSRG